MQVEQVVGLHAPMIGTKKAPLKRGPLFLVCFKSKCRLGSITHAVLNSIRIPAIELQLVHADTFPEFFGGGAIAMLIVGAGAVRIAALDQGVSGG